MRLRARAAASVVAFLAALAPRASRAGDATIAVRSEPPALVLGTGAAATIEIDAGTAAAPEVSASAGRVENVRSLGAGRYAADYVPPREAHPQIAIVTAFAGDRFGWTPIPLTGRGTAVARSAPRAPIRVTIGEATFGPVVSDARGEAHVPVVVPPGIRVALQRGKPLDLGVPPIPHLQLRVARADAPADAAQDVPLLAFAVTPEGARRPGAPVEVSVTVGTVDRFEEIAAGTFRATWRLPPGRAGEAVATARLADDPSPPSTAVLARRAGVAARVVVDVQRARVVAGEEDGPVPVRIRVEDAAGNPAADEPRVEATFGVVSRPVFQGDGSWSASLTVPAERGAARRAEVVARAGGAEGRSSVELAPSLPARLALAPRAATLVADGSTEAVVRVRVQDRFGNDVPAQAPEVAATLGATIASEPDAEGGWRLRYRPARARRAGAEVLSVRAGALEAEASFELRPAERRIGVAPRIGLAASPSGLRSPYVGAEAEYATRLLRGHLALALDCATFVHERTDLAALADATVAVHGRARYVPVLASVRWRERLGAQALWASVGAGVAHVASEVSSEGGPARTESGAVAALRVSASWGMRFGPGMPFAEIGAAWHADPRFETLRGALTVFTVGAGYLYDAY